MGWLTGLFQERGGPKSLQGPQPQLEFSDFSIAIYTAFKDIIYSPRSVLYPSCGYDASPSRVFDNVLFLDLEKGNRGCIASLRRSGLNAIKGDVDKYEPKELHDLVILLNPAIPHEWATKHLKSGGYVLANDWHRSATHMYGQPERFTLVRKIDVVEKEGSKPVAVVSSDLDGLFQTVQDSDEFRRLWPSDFEFERELVEETFDRGQLSVRDGASFDEKWAAYRTFARMPMPYRKVAERYVFVKR